MEAVRERLQEYLERTLQVRSAGRELSAPVGL
jgi:hypothetical protein